APLERSLVFYFPAPPPPAPSPLSLHDALPISLHRDEQVPEQQLRWLRMARGRGRPWLRPRNGQQDRQRRHQRAASTRAHALLPRSEEHTSELQSPYESRMPSSA